MNKRSHRPATFWPRLRQLESRESPTSLLTGPGDVIGAAAFNLFAVAAPQGGDSSLVASWHERDAGYAGPLTRRLATNLLVRMRAVRSATACLGVRRSAL